MQITKYLVRRNCEYMLHFFWGGYDLREDSYEKYEVSNLEIAKWAEHFLGKYTSFHQSSYRAGKVTDRVEDILLGHPTWDDYFNRQRFGLTPLRRDWVRNNALNSNETCHRNTYIMVPWLPDFPSEWTDSMIFLEGQLLSAQKIFAMGGDFWVNKTLDKEDNSIQCRVKHKLIPSNNGTTPQTLTTIKHSFNLIGERRVLHISDLKHRKGFDITCKSLEGVDTLLGVGSVHLQAPQGLVEMEIDEKTYLFDFLGVINNTNADHNQWIVENFDFYIHTARQDAQAVTILENCARGLIPLVTPESGFSSPHAIYLTQNPDQNREIIQWALNLPESELMKRSHLIREQIIQEHSWERIYKKIWDVIMADIDQRNAVLS